MRHREIPEQLETIYFGGGTPSLLGDHLMKMLETASRFFDLSRLTEVTLEANPEDVTDENLKCWKRSGINRLSIGVQSFFDDDLQWMNRLHTGAQAFDSVQRARDSGITAINLDLIYGLPETPIGKWQENVGRFLELDPEHLSAYHLTVEKKTALDSRVRKGLIHMPADSDVVAQLTYLEDETRAKGWERYEISNFCRDGKYALHNTNYWRGKPYMGIGPSAHSFDGKSRRWNVANNELYLRNLGKNDDWFETEELSANDMANETIMLGLRTQWGVDASEVNRLLGFDHLGDNHAELISFIAKGWVLRDGNRLLLSREGRHYADHIASELFVI